MNRLFSYGTLRDPAVQRALFGRQVPTRPDALTGFVLGTVEIADEAVVGLSGVATHPILRPGSPDNRIEGAVLELTDAELVIADGYETDAYRRIEVTLASGHAASVYVAA